MPTMNPVQSIAALRAAGFSDMEIAAACKCHQTAVWRIAKGQRKPRAELAKRLIALARRKGKAPDEPPQAQS